MTTHNSLPPEFSLLGSLLHHQGHLHVQHRDPLPRTYSIAPGGTNRGEHILAPSCRIDVFIIDHNSNI